MRDTMKKETTEAPTVARDARVAARDRLTRARREHTETTERLKTAYHDLERGDYIKRSDAALFLPRLKSEHAHAVVELEAAEAAWRSTEGPARTEALRRHKDPIGRRATRLYKALTAIEQNEYAAVRRAISDALADGVPSSELPQRQLAALPWFGATGRAETGASEFGQTVAWLKAHGWITD